MKKGGISVQPLGHILVVHYAMKRVLPTLLSRYPGHVYAGSVGPDWFYALQNDRGDYHEVSDAIHHTGTRTVYLAMLMVVRKRMQEKNAARYCEAARAFAHGFISHIAADSVYHPYVNRRANHPWDQVEQGAVAHARVETAIDLLLWPKYGDFAVTVDCSAVENPDLLDEPVRQVFLTGLTQAYGNQAWLANLLKLSQTGDREDHPLNEAFRAVRQWAHAKEGLKASNTYSVNDILQQMKNRSLTQDEEEIALNPGRRPWCSAASNERLRASAEDLFDAAINAAAAAIEAGEKYVNGTIDSFDGSEVPFLEQDYNIDTGLPSADNQVIQTLNGEARFTVGIERLSGNYRRYQGSDKKMD